MPRAHDQGTNGFEAAALCALTLNAHLIASDGKLRSDYTLSNAALSCVFGMHEPTANLRRCDFATLERLVAMPPVSAADLGLCFFFGKYF